MKRFDCASVLENLPEYLEPEAREELCNQIAAHLEHCTDCHVYVDKMKKAILIFQAPDRHPKIELPMRTTAELQAALAREYQSVKRSV